MESSGLWTAPTALGCSFALLLAVRLYCSRGGELFALRGSEEVVESSLSRFLTLSTGGIAIFATLSYYQVYDLIPTEVYAWTLPELPRLLDQKSFAAARHLRRGGVRHRSSSVPFSSWGALEPVAAG